MEPRSKHGEKCGAGWKPAADWQSASPVHEDSALTRPGRLTIGRRFSTCPTLLGDLFPFVFVVAHQYLVVQAIRFGRNRKHVDREREHVGKNTNRQELEARVQRASEFLILKGAEHVAPFPEGVHEH